MRTARAQDERPLSDLTARARIRDAGIECFAVEGFGASFRTIADRAGVSPGLITHHFGTKAALRAACDAEVLRQYRGLKTESLVDPSAYLLKHLAEPGSAAQLMVYMLRAIHSGGQPAREFLDHLVDNARDVMRASVEAGVARPSRDEEARVRYLTYQTMGALLIRFLTTPDATPEELVGTGPGALDDHVLPTLELFTEGLLTSRRMLDDYLAYIGYPTETDERPDTPQPPT